MHSMIAEALGALGYRVNRHAYEVIEHCDRWYRADEAEAHARVRVNGEQYEMIQMGFAKRLCADDANLCELLEVNGGGSGAQLQAVKALLEKNAFDVEYRRQLELCAAEGTVACYWCVEGAEEYRNADGSITLKGGRLRLKYIEAGGFIPLTVEAGEITEAAFVGDSIRQGKRLHVLLVCRRDAGGRYSYQESTYDEAYKLLRTEEVGLGHVKPFAVMRVAAVNHLRNMEGFGLPKIATVIPLLAALDQAFTVLNGDIDTADKIVLINEVLCNFKRVVSQEGGISTEQLVPIMPNEQLKRRFVMIGQDKLPTAQSVVEEVVPKIRVGDLEQVIELLLSLLSLSFGYGSRRYSFERGQIQTATQYIGERQDQMQELNRQRQEAKQYVAGVVRAGLWFENAFLGTEWDVDAEVLVAFDDSFITDRATELSEIRNDVLAGIGGRRVRVLYLMKKYHLTQEEAEEWAGSPPQGGGGD
ncbi:MAG: hypothetical protein RR865_13750 [Clostridia bacterium]